MSLNKVDGAVQFKKTPWCAERETRTELFHATVIDVFFILGSLALALSVIEILWAGGLNFGFNIFPFGEDNNWLDMLQRGGGAGAARLFWALDNRNPLSPWWYIAAQNIILNFDVGLLMLRYLMAALLGLSTYYMVVTVAGRQSRSFALAFAILVIFWMANRYTEQILWNFHGALCASLISIAAYAQFINGGRRLYLLYAISLVAWFVAFATYSIQCGAVFAIGYLALRRASVEKSSSDLLRNRVKTLSVAICDTIPYFALFGLFLLLWQTTISAPAVDSISLKFSLAAFAASLGEGLLRMDIGPLFSRVQNASGREAMVVAAAGCGIVTALVLQFRARIGGAGPAIINKLGLLDVVIVLACVAAPTVALESSSSVWYSGTRWPMIYQLTTPAVLLACATVVVVLMLRAGWRRYLVWTVFVGLAVAIGELLSLGHNQLQVKITANEKFIRDEIIRLVAEDLARGYPRPEQVLLMLDDDARRYWRSSDTLSPTIARVWLRRDDISLRVVPWFPAPSDHWTSWWTIQFGSDREGIRNAKVWGGTLPYDKVRVLIIKDRVARRPLVLDQVDVEGWHVDWWRDGPATFLGAEEKSLCPLTWAADQDALSVGWGAPGRDDRGPVRWTTSLTAQVTLPLACTDHAILRVVVAYAVSMTNIEGLILRANGVTLRYRRQVIDGNVIYEAELPREVLLKSPLLRLDLAVKALDRVEGAGAMQFGVAVRAIEILP